MFFFYQDVRKKSPPKGWQVRFEEEEESSEDDEYEQMINNLLNRQKHARQEATKSIDQYLDPLLFWKGIEPEFSSIAKLAKKLFAVPATSAMVERFFSKTGFIMRQHRRSMSSVLAEKLFFIKENKHLLN